MKNFLLTTLIFVTFSFFLFSQTPTESLETTETNSVQNEIFNAAEENYSAEENLKYKIIHVEYELDGRTREYALNKKLDIRMNTVFNSKSQFETYIEYLRHSLTNQRVLETSSLEYTEGQADENNIIPVTLFIHAEDTWNILPVPYPKYDSNDGLEFKIKLKDYNFFGSMEPLDFEISYSQENEGQDHLLGIGFDFQIPFSMWVFDSIWNIDAGIDYTIGDDKPEFDFSTGIGIAFPLKFVTLMFEYEQSVKQDLDYESVGDELYLTESLELSAPFALFRSNNSVGTILLKPYITFDYDWDLDGINHIELLGPTFGYGITFSLGKVDWYNNFRRGFSFSLTQNLGHNLERFNGKGDKLKPKLYGEFKGFYSTNYVGFNSRFYGFTYFGMEQLSKDNIGSRIRGVRDSTSYNSRQVETSSALILNLDIPVKIIQTDWRGWGKAIFKRDMPSWFHIFDFELQISPFIDIALIDNTVTETLFNPKDGLYGSGIEVIVHPSKWRSITVRGSLGIDLGQYLFDDDWRDGPNKEIEIGIGLHY